MADAGRTRYYYRPHRSSWGVWKEGVLSDGGVRADTFVRDFTTKAEARRFVYERNGWI